MIPPCGSGRSAQVPAPAWNASGILRSPVVLLRCNCGGSMRSGASASRGRYHTAPCIFPPSSTVLLDPEQITPTAYGEGICRTRIAVMHRKLSPADYAHRAPDSASHACKSSPCSHPCARAASAPCGCPAHSPAGASLSCAGTHAASHFSSYPSAVIHTPPVAQFRRQLCGLLFELPHLLWV